MCESCGCNHKHDTLIRRPDTVDPAPHTAHNHVHGDGHGHDHEHEHGHGRKILVEQAILSKNDQLAGQNRRQFQARGVIALNLVSSPGSGKTTLLEQTLKILKTEMPLAVIEGDQQTMHDAERIEAVGVPAIQINTGSGCHLDADMISRAVQQLPVAERSLLFIENVGNLVCPALFDLGEECKVVILSVTEGEDKPQKYPYMFQAAQIAVITKTDLLPYVDFDISRAKSLALHVNPDLRIFELSAKTGLGMAAWLDWLRSLRA
ncbi:MAG: hydrogenase accessory protein HypB [Deltaproteobacteria bacterium RIFOXYD12_FULL_50_9]|nr:MAG: hydrogenase accessory protein HypB [Deltaproteobacteria bacterium RIFOXYD12_FULL_50_9]